MSQVKLERIAVDFDGVLFPFENLFTYYCKKQYQITPPEWGGVKSPRFDDLLGIPKEQGQHIYNTLVRNEESWRSFHRPQFRPTQFTGLSAAKIVLARLKNVFDLKFVIVTARDSKYSEKVVREYCATHFPGIFDDFGFCETYSDSPLKMTKAEMCKKFGADLLIDDHIDNILNVQENGIIGVLFGENPWTMHARIDHLKEVNAARDWVELENMIHLFYQ